MMNIDNNTMNEETLQDDSLPSTLEPIQMPPARTSPLFEPREITPQQVEDFERQKQAQKEELSREREMNQHWSGLLNGQPDSLPQELREQAGANDPTASDEEKQYQLLSTINRSWVADHKGIPREQVQQQWPRIRQELAQELDVADSEEECYLGLCEQQEGAHFRKVATDIYQSAFEQGFGGVDVADTREHEARLDPSLHSAAWQVRSAAAKEGKEMRERLLPLAKDLAFGVEALLLLEEDGYAGFHKDRMAQLVESVEDLHELTQEDRRAVYILAAKMREESEPVASKKKEEEGTFSMMRRSLNRGSINLGIGLKQAFTQLGAASLSSMGKQLEDLLGTKFSDASAEIDRRNIVFSEIQALAHQELAPLIVPESSGLIDQILVDVSGALPGTALAMSGYAGFGLIALGGMGASTAEARRLAQDGDLELQTAAGLVSGAAQATIYAGMSRVGGRMLERSISQFMQASGRGAGAYSIAALKASGVFAAETTKLLAASKAAHGLDLALHESAAQLNGTASNIDWEQYGENILDVELNIREAAMNLPFILIGSGRVALRHFNQPRSLLIPDALRSWGIKDTKIREILAETNIDVQGQKLQLALSSSTRWSGVPFLHDAMRSLKLLNTNYYQGFKDPGIVRDFLNLPAEGSLVPRPAYNDPWLMTSRYQINALGKKYGYPIYHTPMAEALKLWDSWWQRSNMEQRLTSWVSTREKREWHRNRARERRRESLRLRFIDEIESPLGSLPTRLQRFGIYNPHAESERRAFLRDRVADLHDLSYRLLLNVDAPESMIYNYNTMTKFEAIAQRSRRIYLSRVAQNVIDRALGMPRDEAMGNLDRGLVKYFARIKRTGRDVEWTKQVPQRMFTHLDEMSRISFEERVQMQLPLQFDEMIQIYLGTQASASMLYELLPQMDDFQTALSRGMSPAQAYAHLIMRELELEPKDLLNYPAERLHGKVAEREKTDWNRKNKRLFVHYKKSTGLKLDSCEGEDGRTYYRAPRPDGSYTRWHEDKQNAVNDLMINVQPYFTSFGKEVRGLAEHRFSIFDQQSNVALQQLHDLQNGSVMGSLQDFSNELNFRRTLAYHNGYIREALRERKALEGASLKDNGLYSVASPLGYMYGRASSYWRGQLQNKKVDPEQVIPFLTKLGYLNERDLACLDKMLQFTPITDPVPKMYQSPWRRSQADYVSYNYFLQDKLARFSSDYFMATFKERDPSPAMREWFRLLPLVDDFLPPVEDNVKLSVVGIIRDGFTLSAQANRRVANYVRKNNELFKKLRQQKKEIETHPLGSEIRASLKTPLMRRYENAWLHALDNEHGLYCTRESVDMLEYPLYSWKNLTADNEKTLRKVIGELCRREPAPSVWDAESRGETPDYVQHAFENLQACLDEYPYLHQYSESQEIPNMYSRISLQKEKPKYDQEPVFKARLWNTEKLVRADYRYKSKVNLPLELRQDQRIPAAMNLLDALRRQALTKPHLTRDGIWWNGERYGGVLPDAFPDQVNDSWQQRWPLQEMLRMLQLIDQQEDGRINIAGVELEGMPKGLDLSSLRYVSIYRDPYEKNHVVRLMPGDPASALPQGRAPYVVRNRGGVYMEGRRAVKDNEQMVRAIVPMEKFRMYHMMHGNEKRIENWSTQSARRLLALTLYNTTRQRAFVEPESGIVNMTELIMRLVEDSSLNQSLIGLGPEQLNYEQASLLKLARQLLLVEFGPPEQTQAAYHDLVTMCRRITRKESSMQALLRALRSTQVKEHNYPSIEQRAEMGEMPRDYRVIEGEEADE